jgi:uncharacterized membrane protein
MFSPRFYNSGETRQMIGEVFLGFILLLLVDDVVRTRAKQLLIAIFAAALVVSHYSLTFLFLSMLVVAWLFGHFKERRSRTISTFMVLLFIVMAFSWYSLVSSSTVKTLYGFLSSLYSSVTKEFFSLEARGGGVYQFFNPTIWSIWYTLESLVAKLIYLFIAIGVFEFVWKRSKNEEVRFQVENAVMVVLSVAVLIANVALPGFGPGFVTERFFHITLFFLSPFCVLGGLTFFRWIELLPHFTAISAPTRPTARRLRLLGCVIVIIFLFKVGFVYEIVGDVPSSIPLGFDRMKANQHIEIKEFLFQYYIPDQDVFSATWLSHYRDGGSLIYADDSAANSIMVYGHVNPYGVPLMLNDTIVQRDSYIYLRYLNVVDGVLVYSDPKGFRYTVAVSDLGVLNSTNRILSSGYCVVHQEPG